MNAQVLKFLSSSAFFLAGLLFISCGKDEDPVFNDIWDIDKDGIPKFVETNYIELDKIYRISKFRSSVGHDYSDGFEQCRSMKHYFEPRSDVSWSGVAIYAPVDGKITRVEQEWAGTKVEMVSEDYPAFRFVIFHINLSNPSLKVNDLVAGGEVLGYHIGPETYSDIAVIVNDPTRSGRFVSFLNTLTEQAFQAYVAKGITKPDDAIISKMERDANPLTCSGGTFTSIDPLENWVTLP